MTPMNRFFVKFLRWPGCPKCENLVAYAVEGLPAEEQQRIRRHLDKCPACREQVRDYVQVTEGLGLCCPENEAPDGFDAKVLAKIRAHANDFPVPPRQQRLGAWPRFWMQVGPVFAGMSVIMTLVASAAIFYGSKPAPAEEHSNELASLSNALLKDPKAARIVLTAADGVAKNASGSLVVCPGAALAYFKAHRLSRCPKGRNYALWMRPQGAQPRRLARFMVESDGSSVHLLQLPEAFKAQGDVDFMVMQEKAEQNGETWLQGSVKL